MMQTPRQPLAREQFAAQLLTLVLTDRPAIGADTGRGRGGALIIRVILISTFTILTSRGVSGFCCLPFLLPSEPYHL